MKIWFAIVFGTCACCVTTVARAEEPPFKLGVIISLTGDWAGVGEACSNGIKMALDSLPENERTKLDLIYEDDMFVPKNTVTTLFN